MPTSTGIVKEWIEHKAFGFILPDDGGEKIFFHKRYLRGDARDDGKLQNGDCVTYETERDEDRGKLQAINISWLTSSAHRDRAEPKSRLGERQRTRASRSSSPKKRGITKRKRHRSNTRSSSSDRSRRCKRSSPSTRSRKNRRRDSKSRSRRRSNPRQKSKGADGAQRNTAPSVSLGKMETFSDMIKIAPEVQTSATGMKTADLTEVCVASAKLKFYDGELLEAVTTQLKSRLKRHSDAFSADYIVKVLGALAELNAYKKDFFASCAKVLAPIVERLTAEQSRAALGAFKATKHEGDEELVGVLVRRTKSENYEAAKGDLFKRQLDRMYGGTRDLQGAPMDTERALLKKPRLSYL